jgi:secreted trypsin-like serine protease
MFCRNNTAGPFDIAVLELSTALVYSQFISPVALNDPDNKEFDNCVASGWGNTLPVSSLKYVGSDTLLTIKTTVLNDLLCAASYPIFRVQRSTTICAKSISFNIFKPLAGTCQGDSGGPMVCKNGDASYLAGIVSCKEHTTSFYDNYIVQGYCIY